MNNVTQNHEQLFQLIPSKSGSTISSTILTTGRYLVGRTESCDVIIPSNIVSSVHAVIEVSPRGMKIYDMNSRNGTYVNGEKIVAENLKINEKVSFGNVEFTLKKYSSNPDLPPVLDALDPIKGKASLLKRELPKSPVEIPAENVDYDDGDDIPYIVYPLSTDPNSDYSEYIFEDEADLYPIFKYELNKQSVEVIILHKDKVYSVDYLPAKDASYNISGLTKKSKEIEFPYLAKEEKVKFIEVHKGNCLINQLHNYEMLHLADEKVIVSETGQVNLQDSDIVKLKNGNLEIYIRKVTSPPKVKTPPFFRRDKDLRKYLFLALLVVLLPTIAMNFINVEEELKDQKDPERIATILYKQKLKLNTNKSVEKTEKKPVKQQKAPKKPVVKKAEPKKTQANQQKSNQKKPVVKNPGNKTAQKVQKVKRVKNPTQKNKNIIRKGQTKSSANTAKATRAQQRRANVKSANKGRVDTYKSFDFKSSINTLMAKGGTLRGARTATTSSSKLNTTQVGGGVSDVATADVSSDPGSLTGAAVGKIGKTKGAEGLSAKTGVYTAGIPSDTVVLGSMDPDVIRRILRNNIPRFRSCYQRELDRNANKDISGMVRMVFTIGASGHVTRAGVDGNSRLPVSVKRCVVGVLKGIDFPRPLGGGTVDVKQPFNFYPKRI